MQETVVDRALEQMLALLEAVTDPGEMSKTEYLELLEELRDDIATRIGAVEEELEDEDG